LHTCFGIPSGGILARLKQLFRYWTAGELFAESERRAWLQQRDGDGLLARLGSYARGERCTDLSGSRRPAPSGENPP
ncbi:MAG: hypothetical protein H6R20_1384, partial [Proteobacteria bacterium]|nr:hypothetical protein [Pseudomonadota bacterium]